MKVKESGNRRMYAVIMAVLMLGVLFAPAMNMVDAEGSSTIFSYTITPDGNIVGDYTAIAGNAAESGAYTSADGSNVGTWGFDSNGYGPFGSFYAAFDPANNNQMICHLNPNNLKQSVDGSIDLTDCVYNIMWCVPTIYVSVDTSTGNLTMTNDPHSGGTALAHTIDGHVYDYVAYGVYEASKLTVGDKTILTSTSGTTPLVSQTRATFRDYANNQLVDVDGDSTNDGYAGLWNFYQWQLYKQMAVAVMNSWNSQAVAGNGSVYGGSPYYDTPGLLDQSGPYAGTKGDLSSGYATYGVDSVKLFIENAWGGVYDFVDGVVMMGKTIVTDTSSVPTDATAAGGENVIVYSSVLPGSGYGSSPSTELGIWGIPTATSGSASSGLCDYIWTSTSDSRVLYVGGCSYTSSSNAPNSGLSYANANYDLGGAYTNLGGRLAFVFDADSASSTPTVTYDHSFLAEQGIDTSSLTDGITITDGTTTYTDMGVVGGFKHVGWMVDGNTYTTTNVVVSTDSHTAVSVWVHVLSFRSDPVSEGIFAFSKYA